MIYLFLDTNIFLHYKDFEQIPWKRITNTEEQLCIVVCPVVIKEIDKIKDTGNPKVKKRAKSISAKFGDIFLHDIIGKIVVVKCKNPSTEQFDGMNFNQLVNDDCIILSALNFISENKCKVIVVSGDNSLLIKAKDNGLNILELEEQYKLKEELSEEEKEKIKLKRELEEIKNRQSSPKIVFNNGDSSLIFSRSEIIDFEKTVEEKIAREKNKNPYDVVYSPIIGDKGVVGDFVKEMQKRRTQKQVDEYNKELDEYFEEFKIMVRFTTENEILKSYLKCIQFYINNIGTNPTGDMEITFDFPDHIILYSKDCIKKEWIEEPIKPLKNGLNRNMLKSIQATKDSMNFYKNLNYNPMDKWQYCWDLSKRIRDNKFKIKRGKLMHNVPSEPIDLLDLYIDARICENFSVDYKIYDENLTKPISGRLLIVIQ